MIWAKVACGKVRIKAERTPKRQSLDVECRCDETRSNRRST